MREKMPEHVEDRFERENHDRLLRVAAHFKWGRGEGLELYFWQIFLAPNGAYGEAMTEEEIYAEMEDNLRWFESHMKQAR